MTNGKRADREIIGIRGSQYVADPQILKEFEHRNMVYLQCFPSVLTIERAI